MYVTKTDIAFANYKSYCARCVRLEEMLAIYFYAIFNINNYLFNFSLIILLIINNKLKLSFKKIDKVSGGCIYTLYFLFMNRYI